MHHPREPVGAVLLDPLSEIPLKNEYWLIFLKITGDLPQVVGRCATKTESEHLLPPLSRAAQKKCAKSRQEPQTEKWRLLDLLKTHRGPTPWWGKHPLNTAGPYLKPPWSSTAWSKCAKSHHEPLAEKWRLANLLKTHRYLPHDEGNIPWSWQVDT